MNQKRIGVVLTYCIMGFDLAIGLFYTPFMLSRLGDSEYGIYSLSASLISFITLLDLGLGQTLVRYISKARSLEDKNTEAQLNGLFLEIYSVIAVIAMVLGIFMITAYPKICSSVMSTNEIYLFRVVFALLLINAVISFPMCVFSSTINAYERFFFLKAVNLIMLFVKYIWLIVLLLVGYKVFAITVVTVVSSIVMQVLYALYCVKKLKISFAFGRCDKKLVWEIFWFSFYIFLNLIIDFLYNSTDKLILGAVRGTVAVSIYEIGIHFQAYLQKLSTAMSGVFLPQITGLYEQKHDVGKLSDIFLKIGRLQLAILSLVLGGFVLFGKEFIILWVGEDFISAYFIGIVIMIPSIVPLTQNIGITILRAMNLHKYRSYMYLVIAVINVGISIPLAVRWEGEGAAIGTALATLAGQICFMNWFYGRKIHLDIWQYWINFRTFVMPVSIMILIGFSIKKLMPVTSWIRIGSYVLVFCCIYLAVYWRFVFNKYEKYIVKSMISRINIRRWV